VKVRSLHLLGLPPRQSVNALRRAFSIQHDVSLLLLWQISHQVATYNETAISQTASGIALPCSADAQAAREKSRRQILDHFDRDNFKEDAHQELILASVRPLEDDKNTAAKKRKRKSTHDWKLCKSFSYVLSSIPTMPILIPGSPVAVVPQSLLTCAAPPSNFPPRKLCSVCGYIALYSDPRSKANFCSIRCKGVQDENRQSSR
jgi:zinc finger HIT domain-containing protein 1